MINQLRSLQFSGISAIVLTLGSMTLLTTPAQAATFDRFSFGGFGRIDNPDGPVNSTATIDFAKITVGNIEFGTPDGTDFGFEISNTTRTFRQITMQDIAGLVKVSQNLSAGPTEERERWERTYDTPLTWLDSPNWDFKLTKFILRRSTHNASTNPGNNDFVGDIFGYFEFNDGTQELLGDSGNLLTSQASFSLAGGDTYSANLNLRNAIPTPALLPGLMGLSYRIWRKRKPAADA